MMLWQVLRVKHRLELLLRRDTNEEPDVFCWPELSYIAHRDIIEFLCK